MGSHEGTKGVVGEQETGKRVRNGSFKRMGSKRGMLNANFVYLLMY